MPRSSARDGAARRRSRRARAPALRRVSRQQRQASLEMLRVQRVAPPHPGIARSRQPLHDGVEVAPGPLEVSQRQVVGGEIDLGVADDLRVAHLVRDHRCARVVLAGALDASDLPEAPAERVEQPALPDAIADPVADLRGLGEAHDRRAVFAQAAERLAEKPARPDHQVRQAETAAAGDRPLAERDAPPIVPRHSATCAM